MVLKTISPGCGVWASLMVFLKIEHFIAVGYFTLALAKTIFSLNLYFYCVNTSYPMDNCFTGRRDRSRQTPEKDVLYIIPAGPVSSVHSLGGASYLLSV